MTERPARAWTSSDVVTSLVRLLCAGAVVAALWVLGDVVWMNTGANAAAQLRQSQMARQAEASWAIDATSRPTSPFVPGEVIAVLRIPRFGLTWVRPIGEGTDTGVLDTIGVGHYPGSAYAGEIGNLALAAHRTTHGAAFLDIDALVPGDSIIVQTPERTVTYEVVSSAVVSSDAVDAVAPVPNQPGVAPIEAWLTLTTHTPKYTTLQRLVVWAHLRSP